MTLGGGTARGGHLACTEKVRWVRIPHCPLNKSSLIYCLNIKLLILKLNADDSRKRAAFHKR